MSEVKAISDFVEPSKGRIHPSNVPNTPYIGLEHIEKASGLIKGQGVGSDTRSTKAIFKKGDLLYGKLRPNLNKTWVAEFDGVCSTDIIVYPSNERYETRFLKYRFMCNDFINYAVENCNGVNLPRVNAKKIAAFTLTLPALTEQRQIVQRIESLFSRLDAGVASLQHAKAQLQRYRQSVLTAAVTGELTQAWRKANPDTEPASKLLKRILQQRREEWNGRGKYKEPGRIPESNLNDLPSIPSNWCWVSYEQCSWEITVGYVGSMKSKYQDKGIPFLRSQNVRPMKFSPANLVFIDKSFDKELKKSRLEGGEILLTRSGANVGQCCVYPRSNGLANCSDIVITRPLNEFNPEYGAMFMNSPLGSKMLHLNKVGNAQAHFNVGSMKVAPVPLPPIREQVQIILEFEARTSSIDYLEAALEEFRGVEDELAETATD